VLLLCAACVQPKKLAGPPVFNIHDRVLFEYPVDGKPHAQKYVYGWQDGCRTGVAASSRREYSLRRNFIHNWDLVADPRYNKGWNDAFEYCRQYQRSQHLTKIGLL
jgi:hypothetical protein